MHTRPLSPVVLSLSMAMLAACAGTPSAGTGAAQTARPMAKADIPFSSAECLAAKLRQGEPFPASAVPADALARRQGGWVAIRYDVLDGRAQNLPVVASDPPGLYDAAALAHHTGSGLAFCQPLEWQKARPDPA